MHSADRRRLLRGVLPVWCAFNIEIINLKSFKWLTFLCPFAKILDLAYINFLWIDNLKYNENNI